MPKRRDQSTFHLAGIMGLQGAGQFRPVQAAAKMDWGKVNRQHLVHSRTQQEQAAKAEKYANVIPTRDPTIQAAVEFLDRCGPNDPDEFVRRMKAKRVGCTFWDPSPGQANKLRAIERQRARSTSMA